MPSIYPADPDSDRLVYHPVQVVDDHGEFLRTRINDPEARFQQIRALILNFSFPVLHTRLPFTAVRCIMSQCLISRIRPYLSYQPITRSRAAELDRLLALRVHNYFRFPFRFNSALLFLPISHLGFGFPSVTHLNDTAAVPGLLRDVNHHIDTFRLMARITLAGWTCSLNNCQFPLEGAVSCSFARSVHVLPTTWLVAYDMLRYYRIAVRSTDQSFFVSGDVALHRLAHILVAHPQVPSSLVITNFERATSPTCLKSRPGPAHLFPRQSPPPFPSYHDWPLCPLLSSRQDANLTYPQNSIY